jgi:hypothetical protein
MDRASWACKIEEKGALVLSRLLAGIGKTLRWIFRLRVKPARGRRDDPDDGTVGAGVTVRLKPPPPALVGREAKMIPTGDDDANRSDMAA